MYIQEIIVYKFKKSIKKEEVLHCMIWSVLFKFPSKGIIVCYNHVFVIIMFFLNEICISVIYFKKII